MSGAVAATPGSGQAGATATMVLPTTAQTAAEAGTAETSSAGEGQWKVDEEQEIGVRFSYPAGWQTKSAYHVEGADGFAWLETLNKDGAGPGAVCQGEANRDKPESYGAFPQIVDGQKGEYPSCLILPSADQPDGRKGEALYLMWTAAPGVESSILALHADREHIQQISQSLSATGGSVKKTVSACNYQMDGVKPETQQQGGLRIDLFPVAQGGGCSPYQEAVKFNEVTSAGVPADRAGQVSDSQYGYARLARLNKALAPFGVQVQAANQLLKVFQGGKLLRANLNWVGQLSVNASGSDFLLPVVDSYNGSTYMISTKGIQTLDDWNLLLYDHVFPVYTGDDQISLAYDYQRYERPTNSPALLNVLKNGQVVDTLSVDGSTSTGGPARGLWSWDDHWILELPGLVIQDGQSLNDRLGYAEMFTWRLLRDQPFFFFRKNGQVQVSFNGQTLPLTFDEVIYQPQQGMANLIRMQNYEDGLLFYARRGETWYYVVIQVQ